MRLPEGMYSFQGIIFFVCLFVVIVVVVAGDFRFACKRLALTSASKIEFQCTFNIVVYTLAFLFICLCPPTFQACHPGHTPQLSGLSVSDVQVVLCVSRE